MEVKNLMAGLPLQPLYLIYFYGIQIFVTIFRLRPFVTFEKKVGSRGNKLGFQSFSSNTVGNLR